MLGATLSLSAQKEATLTVQADKGTDIIPKEIYGQFAEHLGSCIYGGIWVGENSDIPNIKGYRTDVFNALKALQVPVMRWPGGCFADEYHWMDGIGPRDQRPKMVNNNWGGTVEDNSFGTHEFLNLCEMLGCEPYVSGNVGSGTVEETSAWGTKAGDAAARCIPNITPTSTAAMRRTAATTTGTSSSRSPAEPATMTTSGLVSSWSVPAR